MTEHSIYQTLITFNTYSILFRLLLATIFGGIIGWERGLQGHVAGLRTHILVCLGSAMTLMLGMFCRYRLGLDVDVTRVGAQVISGIGFLGVGTILIRDNTQVTGVTTAAGLWTTAAIGLSIGAGFYLGALLCVVIVVITMSILANMERSKKKAFVFTKLYAELQEPKYVVSFQETLRELGPSFDNFSVCAPHSGIPGHLGVELDIRSYDSQPLVDALRALGYVDFVVTSD